MSITPGRYKDTLNLLESVHKHLDMAFSIEDEERARNEVLFFLGHLNQISDRLIADVILRKT